VFSGTVSKVELVRLKRAANQQFHMEETS